MANYAVSLLGTSFVARIMGPGSDPLLRTVYEQNLRFKYRDTPEQERFTARLVASGLRVEDFSDVPAIASHLLEQIGLDATIIVAPDVASVVAQSPTRAMFYIVHLTAPAELWPAHMTFANGERHQEFGRIVDDKMHPQEGTRNAIALYTLLPNKATTFAYNALRMLSNSQRIHHPVIDRVRSAESVFFVNDLIQPVINQMGVTLDSVRYLPIFIRKCLIEHSGYPATSIVMISTTVEAAWTETLQRSIATNADWLIVLIKNGGEGAKAPLVASLPGKQFRLVSETNDAEMLNLDYPNASIVALYEPL